MRLLPRRSPDEKHSDQPEGRRRSHLLPAVLSIIYVAAVLGFPLAVNFGLCTSSGSWGICWLLPTTKLTEFDKWGSYLSGALVPLSLIWVAMAFRLQQRQLLDQARQQARAAEIAFESQRIADRQALSALADTYLERMDEALRNLAELINSNLPSATEGSYDGRVPDNQVASSMTGVAQVFTSYHNIFITLGRGGVNEEEVHSLKALFVDSDMSDHLGFFFETFNEFHARCKELDCLILIPPHVRSMAGHAKVEFPSLHLEMASGPK